MKTFNVNLKEKMKKRSCKDKVKLVLAHPLCVLVNIAICGLIINNLLSDKFYMEPCGENEYENDQEICQNCLLDLNDPYCLSCASSTECTSCAP